MLWLPDGPNHPFCARRLNDVNAQLAAAAAAGEVRADVNAEDLLNAVANLCRQAPGEDPARARRMVAVLVDGLRYGARPSTKKRSSR